jgi:RNA polymerase sigma factor (sigma-70 family)
VSDFPDPAGLVEKFFRRDYSRVVAMLVRRVGVRHIELIEDAVQSACMAALTAWTQQSARPNDPRAWLFKVAYHRVVQDLRREAGRAQILDRVAGDATEWTALPDEPVSSDEIRDDLLRILFVCCDEAIPWESRLVLALKTLCGFSISEIALRLFISEANAYKRLSRARERLREVPADLKTPPLATLRHRVSTVHDVLYLLFNEGYLSAQGDQAIRRELCDEAVRLATVLADHPVGAVPETFALLALMHFHTARLGSRVDAAGGVLLLEEQDRARWDREHIQLGAQWLERSATGDTFFALSRRGGHRGGALRCAFVSRDALERDRRSLCDARARGPFSVAQLESCTGYCRVARTGSGALRDRGTRTATVVGGFVSLGCRAGRSASPCGTPGGRSPIW